MVPKGSFLVHFPKSYSWLYSDHQARDILQETGRHHMQSIIFPPQSDLMNTIDKREIYVLITPEIKGKGLRAICFSGIFDSVPYIVNLSFTLRRELVVERKVTVLAKKAAIMSFNIIFIIIY